MVLLMAPWRLGRRTNSGKCEFNEYIGNWDG